MGAGAGAGAGTEAGGGADSASVEVESRCLSSMSLPSCSAEANEIRSNEVYAVQMEIQSSFYFSYW